MESSVRVHVGVPLLLVELRFARHPTSSAPVSVPTILEEHLLVLTALRCLTA